MLDAYPILKFPIFAGKRKWYRNPHPIQGFFLAFFRRINSRTISTSRGFNPWADRILFQDFPSKPVGEILAELGENRFKPQRTFWFHFSEDPGYFSTAILDPLHSKYGQLSY